MLRRYRLLCAISMAIVIPAVLFCQDSLPATLEQLQDTLKRLQSEVKSLQETVQRLTKEAASDTDKVKSVQPVGAWRNASEAYKQGKQLEDGRQYRAAIEAYSRAAQFDPKSDAAFLHRGYSRFQLGENTDAVSDFTQSLALQPNSSRAYLARALALAAGGQNEKALLDAEQALQRDPQYLDAYLLRGRLNQLQGNDQLASTDFEKAVTLPPNSEKAYLGRAANLEYAGRAELALADCEKAAQAHPDASAGYLCRAQSYLKMKLPERAAPQPAAPERAAEDADRALATAPTFSQPLPLPNSPAQPIPQAAPAAPNASGAAPAPVKPVEPQPEFSPAPVSQPVKVVEPTVAGRDLPAIRASLQLADAQQYIRQGRDLVQKDQFEQAVSPLNRAIDTDPWSSVAYNLRGYVMLRLRHFDDAAADCTQAIRLRPQFLNAYQNRSSARRHQGDGSGAKKDAHKVADLIAGSQTPGAPKPALSAKR